MKKCDSKRSWIGGEGIPSRDPGQRKRENSHTIEGSSAWTMQVFRYSPIVSMSFNFRVAQIAHDNAYINHNNHVVSIHDHTTSLETNQASHVFDVLCLFSLWAIFSVRDPW
jgi:hypothetical protein